MATTSSIDYGYLRQLVFGLSQNVLDPSRDYLFESRLARLVRNQGMNGLEELIDSLRIKKNPDLERAVSRPKNSTTTTSCISPSTSSVRTSSTAAGKRSSAPCAIT